MLLKQLDITGAASLGYVGHSQGTTIALAMLSSKPAVASLINVSPADLKKRPTKNPVRRVRRVTWSMLLSRDFLHHRQTSDDTRQSQVHPS
jgi:pimeloyl-ACP methyl ester carboxylesterase